MNEVLEKLARTNKKEHLREHIVCDMPSGKVSRYQRRWVCEAAIPSEEKLQFLDMIHSGRPSRKLALMEKFNKDRPSLEMTQMGFPTARAMKKWVGENDTEGFISFNKYRKEWYLTIEGKEIVLDSTLFQYRKTKEAYADMLFNCYLHNRERDEKYAVSEGDKQSKEAEQFDHDTWNHSLLHQTALAIGIDTCIKPDQYSRSRVYGIIRQEHGDIAAELTSEELALLYDCRDKVQTFMDSLKETPEVARLLERINTEGFTRES